MSGDLSGFCFQVSSAWCDARKASAAAKRMSEPENKAHLNHRPLRQIKTVLFVQTEHSPHYNEKYLSER